MKTTKPLTGILIALTVLVLASVACSFTGMQIKPGSTNITVTLQEEDINRLLANSTNHIDDRDVLLREVTALDMKDGSITVYGTYRKADGSEGTGSYDLALGTQNGELKAEITGVDMEGVDLADPRIQKMNSELSESLAQSARQSKEEVKFESVQITDEALTIRVKAQWGSD
jgi:hypothetical protein